VSICTFVLAVAAAADALPSQVLRTISSLAFWLDTGANMLLYIGTKAYHHTLSPLSSSI
jgi:hypothetical protein